MLPCPAPHLNPERARIFRHHPKQGRRQESALVALALNVQQLLSLRVQLYQPPIQTHEFLNLNQSQLAPSILNLNSQETSIGELCLSLKFLPEAGVLRSDTHNPLTAARHAAATWIAVSSRCTVQPIISHVRPDSLDPPSRLAYAQHSPAPAVQTADDAPWPPVAPSSSVPYPMQSAQLYQI